MTDKQEVKDEKTGEVKRAEKIPSVKEIICPFVHMLTGGATRYDVTFSPVITVGEAEAGAWRSAPQITLTEEARDALKSGEKKWHDITPEDIQEDEKGQRKARSYALRFYQALERMQESGEITWKEQAFYFTHEQGIEAREKYIQSVLQGERKANRRSWTGTPTDPEKPGFGEFAGVSWEQLEKGEVPNPAQTMKTMEWFKKLDDGGASMELYGDATLGEYIRATYKKSTTTTVSKTKKRELIATAMKKLNIDMETFLDHLSEIASETSLDADEIKELTLGDANASKETIASTEEKNPDEETSSADQVVSDPSPEELLAIEISEPSEEELVAGVSAVEAELRPIEDVAIIRVPVDPSRERIDVKNEAIVWNMGGNEQVIAYLVELPESETEAWLEPGYCYRIQRWRLGEEPGVTDLVCVLPEYDETSTQQEAD